MFFLEIVLEISIYRGYSACTSTLETCTLVSLWIWSRFSKVVLLLYVCLFVYSRSKFKFCLSFFFSISFQKVYYSMYSTMDNMVYESTVRGCAWDCLPKDDFQNCSSELHGSRGCVTRNCCRDNDLCNQGSRTNSVLTSSHLSCLFLLVLSSYFVTWKYFYLLLKMLFIFVGTLWFLLLAEWKLFSFFSHFHETLYFKSYFAEKYAKVP